MMIIWMSLLLSCTKSVSTISKQSNEVGEKHVYLQTHDVKLSPPKVNVDSILFVDSAEMELGFSLDGVSLFYSLNDQNFRGYDQALSIKQTSSIRVFSHKAGFLNSDTVEINVVRSQALSNQVELSIYPNPSSSYPGGGEASFFDLKKGSFKFREGRAWSGFQSDEVVFDLKLKSEEQFESIGISYLLDQGSWIFAPESIEVYSNSKLVGEMQALHPAIQQASRMDFMFIPIEKNAYQKLKIRVFSLKQIPDWHAGKGTRPWLFIDEIIFN